MVPYLVPTSIALSQVTSAVPGLSWDHLTLHSIPVAEYPRTQEFRQQSWGYPDNRLGHWWDTTCGVTALWNIEVSVNQGMIHTGLYLGSCTFVQIIVMSVIQRVRYRGFYCTLEPNCTLYGKGEKCSSWHSNVNWWMNNQLCTNHTVYQATYTYINVQKVSLQGSRKCGT